MAWVLLGVLAGPPGAAGQHNRQLEVTPNGARFPYTVTADGAVTSSSILVENAGTRPISGIWLALDGRDLSTIDGILNSIVRDGMTDEQRARAIWQFSRTQAYAWNQYSDFAEDAADPVRFFNSYGYGLCSDFAAAMASLYRRAGFPVRIWSIGLPSGHVVPEVYFSGAWHVMDANRDLLALERDNRTIAGVASLVADRWLLDRAGAFGEGLGSLYATTPPAAFGDVDAAATSTLRLHLRPGDRFEYLPEAVGLYRHDTAVDYGPPPTYGNAALTTAPAAALHDAGVVFETGHGLDTRSEASATWWAPVEPSTASPRYVVSVPHPLVRSSLRVTARFATADDRISVYAAKGVANLAIGLADLVGGTVPSHPAVESLTGLLTLTDDGLFPALHVGPTGSGELVLRVERASPSEPLEVGGTFFRFTESDTVAVDVSQDGVAWTTVWTPSPEEVGYFEASALATEAVAGAIRVFVRFRFAAVSFGGWTSGANQVTVSGVSSSPTELIGTLIPAEGATSEFDLTSVVAPVRGAASEGYVLRFAFEGQAGLVGFSTSNTMQVAPAAIPKPVRGQTRFVVTSDEGATDGLRILHTWRDVADAPEPLPPTAPLSPAVGERLAITDATAFTWVPHGSSVPDDLWQYQLQICADATCGSPLSSVTELPHRLDTPPPVMPVAGVPWVAPPPALSPGASTWFEPGQTYFWRVRVQNSEGEWGAFSETWSFIAASPPANPVDLSIDADTSGESTSPWLTLTGTVPGAQGPTQIRWTTDRGATGMVTTTDLWTLNDVPLSGGPNVVTLVATDEDGQSSTRHVTVTVPYFSYYLAEGTTRGGFETDVMVANPTAHDAEVEVFFLLDDGTTEMRTTTLRALTSTRLAARDVVGTDTSFAVEVRSPSAVPLSVERLMRWGAGGASGHGGAAMSRPSRSWFFAEGSQGYFDTFVLLANPQDDAALVTLTFMTEAGRSVAVTERVAPRARHTVWTRNIAALASQSFSITVSASLPVFAERAMYFGDTGWTGGHAAAGAPQAGVRWLSPEGATGPYFDTYLLVGNPSPAHAADLTVQYVLPDGRSVTESLSVPAHSRLTLDVESRAPLLADTAVSTVVSATRPVVVERASYWGGRFPAWIDGHASLAQTSTGSSWAVADVRIGGDDRFEAWLLLTNAHPTDLAVDVTVLPESGPPTTLRLTVPATSRHNVYANAEFQAFEGQRVGVAVKAVDGRDFAVEKSQYWSVGGVTWSGGSSTGATRIP